MTNNNEPRFENGVMKGDFKGVIVEGTNNNKMVLPVKHMDKIKEKEWKDKAISRYEEYTDVHSEINFAALMRALQIAEDTMSSQLSDIIALAEEMKKDDMYKERGWEGAVGAIDTLITRIKEKYGLVE